MSSCLRAWEQPCGICPVWIEVHSAEQTSSGGPHPRHRAGPFHPWEQLPQRAAGGGRRGRGEGGFVNVHHVGGEAMEGKFERAVDHRKSSPATDPPKKPL